MREEDIEMLLKNSCELKPDNTKKDEIIKAAKSQMNNNSLKSAIPPKIKFLNWLLPIAACLTFAFLIAGVSGAYIGLQNENYQTVYIDINPSVALTVNRFDKVNKVEFLNEDARNVLSNVKLAGLTATEALEIVIDNYENAGYFTEEADIYISAVANKNGNAEKLLEKLINQAEKVKGNRKYCVNQTHPNQEDKVSAEQIGISPGKYKLIKEIIEKYPEYTIEELKDLSMSELKKILNKN